MHQWLNSTGKVPLSHRIVTAFNQNLGSCSINGSTRRMSPLSNSIRSIEFVRWLFIQWLDLIGKEPPFQKMSPSSNSIRSLTTNVSNSVGEVPFHPLTQYRHQVKAFDQWLLRQWVDSTGVVPPFQRISVYSNNKNARYLNAKRSTLQFVKFWYLLTLDVSKLYPFFGSELKLTVT